jgi:hypothetical protein
MEDLNVVSLSTEEVTMKTINTHLAVQVSATRWLVTFVTGLGFAEVRVMTSKEFIEMVQAEALFLN